MNLTERVRLAGYENVDYRQGTSMDMVELKRRVQEIIPPDEIALIMAQNPKRAENEVKAACYRVFEQNPWIAQGKERRDELIAAILDGVFGFGPLESLLADDEVTEIMVNGSRSLYVEKQGLLFKKEAAFSNDEEVRALIDRIIGPIGRRVDESSPMVNARLPQGHRVNAIIPPLALDGPILTVRKFREHVILLEEMIDLGSIDQTMACFLSWAVQARKNIAVSGGTGSGKTTLLNALSCKINPSERIITIEDSAELRFLEHPHVVRLEARPKNSEGIGEVTIRDLVINSLRMRPDRIVVGECRGAEALDMLQAMNTGHDGSLTTLHANSPADAIMRLSTMVRYAGDLPIDVIEAQIACALDCVIQIARASDGHRFVSDVVSVEYDHQSKEVMLESLYSWDPLTKIGGWASCPDWLQSLPLRGICNEGEVEKWMSSAFSE